MMGGSLRSRVLLKRMSTCFHLWMKVVQSQNRVISYPVNRQAILNQKNLDMWRFAMKHCLFPMKMSCNFMQKTVETARGPASIYMRREEVVSIGREKT